MKDCALSHTFGTTKRPELLFDKLCVSVSDGYKGYNGYKFN
jgi:hypothetical protein